MSLVKRVYPQDAKNIFFSFNDKYAKEVLGDENESDYGSINLGRNITKELKNLADVNKIVTKYKKVYVHFPLRKNFYVAELSSNIGFTLKNILTNVNRIGEKAFKYDFVHRNDTNYESLCNKNDKKYESALGEYAVISSDGKSDIVIKGNKIYVSVQH